MSELQEIKDLLLAEEKKGNVVVNTFEGLAVTPLNEFIKQPTDGLLYDLNRDGATIMSFLDDEKWINDYAVSLVIEKLKSIVDKQSETIRLLKEGSDRLSDAVIGKFRNVGKTEIKYECQLCENGFYDSPEEVQHSKHCPVYLHNELMKQLEEK